jgi:hypothetical protein
LVGRFVGGTTTTTTSTTPSDRRHMIDEERALDNAEHDDDAGPRIRALLTLLPTLATSSNPIAKTLTSVANWLDHVCITAAHVLRRNPIARVGLLVYLV